MSKEITEIRESAIRAIDESTDKKTFIYNNADLLFNLDLTMYSRNNSLNSLLYNAITVSKVVPSISLHPDQWKALKLLDENAGLILSAPTSFGKTFVVFEYIARKQPKTVVLVVPTLALVDEYKQKLFKEYNQVFKDYKIYITLDKAKESDNEQKKIFIVTHDKVVDHNSFEIFDEIDFLVIDEVYKLDSKSSDDRKLVLNFAYYYLVKKSHKHLLLAPFISEIQNLDKFYKKPAFFKTSFSPVVNEVKVRDIPIDDEDTRFFETNRIINQEIKLGEKTLVYFSNATDIPKFSKAFARKNFVWEENSEDIIDFINWAAEEIHPEWYLVKAMKSGFVVHSGELPLGVRNYQIDLFNSSRSNYDIILGTSTLLEGVNTSTQNIIITKPSRSHSYSRNYFYSNDFEAFDFFNLVGRSGRMFKHFLGTAYYIKAPDDKEYRKEDAVKSIEFELTSNSIDVQIQLKECESEEYLSFLKMLNCSQEEYLEKIGYTSFEKIQRLYRSYHLFKKKLCETIIEYMTSDHKISIIPIIYWLHKIVSFKSEDNYDNYLNYRSTIIRNCINKKRLSIRQNIENVQETLKDNTYFSRTVDQIVSDVIKIKNTFIEYDFFKYVTIIVFFMEKENIKSDIKEFVQNEILGRINYIYYKDQPGKRALKELGIFDKDIEIIAQNIELSNLSLSELQLALKIHYDEFKNEISYVSNYIIRRMI